MARKKKTSIKKLLSGIFALIIIGLAGILGTNEEFVNTVLTWENKPIVKMSKK